MPENDNVMKFTDRLNIKAKHQFTQELQEEQSPQNKVRIGYSPRVLHRLWDAAAGQKKEDDGWGQFTRGAESTIRGAFKRSGMSAEMLDHKKRLIPRDIRENEAFFLLGAAADVAEAREKGLHSEPRKRARFEIELAKAAIKEGKIVYGECGGMQTMLMFMLGLDLEKYIKPVKEGGEISHFGVNKMYEAAHSVTILDENSVMGKIAKAQDAWDPLKNNGTLEINSVHKQGMTAKDFFELVKDVDQFFQNKGQEKSPFVIKLTAVSPDGYVEGMEIRERCTDLPIVNMVQFHPIYTRQSGAAAKQLAPGDTDANIPENAAEKVGNAYLDILRDQIVQSRTQKSALETREALLDFVQYKCIDQKRGIDYVNTKFTKEPYDMQIPSNNRAVITH